MLYKSLFILFLLVPSCTYLKGEEERTVQIHQMTTLLQRNAELEEIIKKKEHEEGQQAVSFVRVISQMHLDREKVEKENVALRLTVAMQPKIQESYNRLASVSGQLLGITPRGGCFIIPHDDLISAIQRRIERVSPEISTTRLEIIKKLEDLEEDPNFPLSMGTLVEVINGCVFDQKKASVR